MSYAEQMLEAYPRDFDVDQDCADVCISTGRVLSRQTERDADMARTVLEASGVRGGVPQLRGGVPRAALGHRVIAPR